MSRFGCVGLVCAAVLGAQVRAPSPQTQTIVSDVDDSEQPYALYLPSPLEHGRNYPLVIMLHGESSNYRQDLRRLFGQGDRPGELDIEASRYFPRLRDIGFIVAAPLARGSMGYGGIAERDVLAVLADVKRRYPVDNDRVYLTGLSMGGGGALRLGLTQPDLWAAIAAVCPAVPSGLEQLAGNAMSLPVKLFQGAIDPVVNPAETREWQARFRQAGVKSEYEEFPGVRHNSWDPAYKGGSIFDWFSQFRRKSYPEHVYFATANYKRSSAYWVRFDILTPGSLASFDGKWEDGGRLIVQTSGLDAFTITLTGGPAPAQVKTLVLSVDGASFRPRIANAISFSKARGSWTFKKSTPTTLQKRKDAEGPIREAISARHIYVYGTEGSPAPPELIRRREQALHAANWSVERTRVLVNFPVMADAEVKTAETATANLILFGTRETNTLIAKMADRLPMALNPGAADYGLLYIYPHDGRYVLVNSGLPWWTHIDQVKRPPYSFGPRIPGVLSSLGDYVVYRGGIDNVVAEGRFDRNWKLPAEALPALEVTHAIEVRR